jgi:polar amino acid transport system ATP-binding protein/sulfate transport system ATP-binding protein
MYSYKKEGTILKVENVSLTLGNTMRKNKETGEIESVGGTNILKNVNIEIKNIVRPDMTQGQIVGMLGPSGVGKTKFFELLSGILPLDNKEHAFGKILVGEEQEPVKLGRVGVIQQSYPLFEHRTVYGNLQVAAAIKFKNKTEREDRITHILKEFDMDKRKNFYPAQLSGGQKQRVAIAQQILCSNNFLLMDEPFSGLDPVMIKKVSNFILKVANMHELNTIIIVSHDIFATCVVSDTIWVMGRQRASNGDIIPGANIVREYDLMERGLAWRPDIHLSQAFRSLVDEIYGLFPTL